MRSQRGRALAVLVLVWLAFFLPVFKGEVRFPVDYAGPATPGQAPTPVANGELGDAYYAMYPWHHYLGERLRDGELPLWDPHRFAGTPFAADIGVGTWYPPNWAYAADNQLLVFTLLSMAASLAALLVTYWFLRVHGLHPAAAAFGAVAFAFSAFLVKWATNETVANSTVWMALPLGGLEVARQGRRRRGITIAAAGLVLPILGGHAQIALYVWLATAIWVVVSMVAAALGPGGDAGDGAGGPGPSLVPRVLGAGLPAVAAVVLAVGIGAVQVFPALELSSEALRQKTTFDVARGSFLPDEHLPTLLVPDYLGSPVDSNYAGPGVNYTDTAVYAGLLTLPLAVLGLLYRRRRLAVFLGVVGAVSFMGATGTPPGFYRFLLTLPGFDRTLSAARMSLLFNFAVAGLAALGLDRLLDPERPRRAALALLGGAQAALAGLVLWLAVRRPDTTLPDDYVLERGLRALAVVALGAVLIAAMAAAPAWTGRLALGLVALAGVDLWMSGYRFNTFHEPRTVYHASPAIKAVQAAAEDRTRYADVGPALRLPPNDALVHRQYGIGGYDPLIPRRIVELVSEAEDFRDRARSNFFGPFQVGTARSALFDLLGVGRQVADPGLAAEVAQQPVVLGPASVFDQPGAFPPAFLVPCWEQVGDTEGLRRLGTMPARELGSVALVAASGAARRALGADRTSGCAPAPATAATVATYQPERVVVRTDGAAPSVLVLTDTWFPGWEATVDGRPAPVLRVDHALRGVAVPAGRHLVEFRYRPGSLRVGAAVTALTLLVLVGSAAGAELTRRRRRAGSARGSASPAEALSRDEAATRRGGRRPRRRPGAAGGPSTGPPPAG